MIDRTTAGRASLDVDRLLRDYYRAEMPNPWPRLTLPGTPLRRTPPRFSRHLLRFALAASVVIGLLSYWSLAGLFPNEGSLVRSLDGPEIGKTNRPVPSKHLAPVEQIRTPGGNNATVFEEETPGGIAINVLGTSNSKGPR
jgi:hypothetical protein